MPRSTERSFSESSAASRLDSIYDIPRNEIARSSKTESSSWEVKLEESQETSQLRDGDNVKDHSWKGQFVSEETSSNSHNIERADEGGAVGQQAGEVANTLFQIHTQRFSAEGCATGKRSLQRLQSDQSLWAIQSLREHTSRKSPHLGNVDMKREESQSTGGPVLVDAPKPETGIKRESMEAVRTTRGLSRLVQDAAGERFKGKSETSPKTEDSNERRVHARVDDQTAALQSLFSREYTEESTGARTIRQSGGKDRHSKVFTSKGPRDRRVRLSVSTAIQFYDVQDRLGYDQPSKAVEWLIKKAQSAIDELENLPDLGLQRFRAAEREATQALRIQEPSSGPSGLSSCSCCTNSFACSNEGSCMKDSKQSGSVNALIDELVENGKGIESPTQAGKQGYDKLSEEQQPVLGSVSDSSLILNDVDMDCSSHVEIERRDEAQPSAVVGTDARLIRGEGRTKERGSENGSEMSGSFVHMRGDGLEYGAFSSSAHVGALDSAGSDQKLLDQDQALTFSSSMSSSMRLHEKPTMLEQSLLSRCLGISSNWLQDQFMHHNQLQLPFTALSSVESPQFHSTSTLQGGTHQYPDLQFQPSFHQSMMRLLDHDVHTCNTARINPDFSAGESNSLTAPVVASRQQFPAHVPHDQNSSNQSLLQSLIMLSPDQMYDFGCQISTAHGGSNGEVTKPTPIHQGYTLGSVSARSDAGRAQQEDHLQLAPALEDDIFSTASRTTLADASHNCGGPIPSSAFSVAALNTSSIQSTYADPALPVPASSYSPFMLSRSRIPARIHGFEDYEGDQQEQIS